MPPKTNDETEATVSVDKKKEKKSKKSKTEKQEKKAIMNGENKKKEKTNGRHRQQSLKIYLRRLLKQVHPSLGIKTSTLEALDMIMKDLNNKFDEEAAKLCKTGKKHTITQKHIQTASRILLPGELSKHAIAEGTKAMSKYKISRENEPKKPKVAKENKP